MMKRHIEVLEKILDGYHPVTGERLPIEHVFCEPDVLRALHHAIEVLKNEDNQVKELKPQNRLSSKRDWTEADDRKLCELYKNKIPIKEIAKELSRREKGIEKRLDYLREVKRQQIERKKYENQTDLEHAVLYNRNAKWMKEDEEKLFRLFDQRMSIKEIAVRLGRTPKAIEYRMIHLGLIERRGQYVDGIRPWTSRDNDLLRSLYEDRIDISLIAARFEVSEEAIKSRLFYMGLIKDAPNVLPDRNKNKEDKEI